jgi:Family of unknown function (DUF5709)
VGLGDLAGWLGGWAIRRGDVSIDDDSTDGYDTDSGLLEPDESLDYRGVEDVLDEGYSPPERPLGLDEWGTTPREEHDGESLDQLLAREVPERIDPPWDGLGDTSDTDGELLDGEVGDVRSGRLVASDDGGASDFDEELFAEDAGIDGGAASAEEAAVHVVVEPDRDRDDEN